MGDIPAKTAMVSSVIINPQTGGKAIQSDTTFNITVQMSNLVAGSFTNADATYYSAPQALQNGQVVGHTHVTVQDMGNSLNPTTALDPTQFAFFKGINDAGNGKGLLTATVTGGLPAGNYRVCTMASASNHQPVLMPVAQRGTADDCTKFVVSGNGNTANAASNNGSGGQAAAVSYIPTSHFPVCKVCSNLSSRPRLRQQLRQALMLPRARALHPLLQAPVRPLMLSRQEMLLEETPVVQEVRVATKEPRAAREQQAAGAVKEQGEVELAGSSSHKLHV
jgi:hypothetical protein